MVFQVSNLTSCSFVILIWTNSGRQLTGPMDYYLHGIFVGKTGPRLYIRHWLLNWTQQQITWRTLRVVNYSEKVSIINKKLRCGMMLRFRLLTKKWLTIVQNKFQIINRRKPSPALKKITIFLNHSILCHILK